MDALTFAAKLIEALAWPALVAAVLIYIRQDLPRLIASLRRLKFKEIEVEFGEAAKKVAVETTAAVPVPKPDAQLHGENEREVESRLKSIADLSPRAAILEAWLRVEAAAVAVIRKRGAAPLKSTPRTVRLREALERADALTPPQVAAYEGLRHLRNAAVHTPEAEFTAAAVADYIQAALAMASYLEEVARLSQTPAGDRNRGE